MTKTKSFERTLSLASSRNSNSSRFQSREFLSNQNNQNSGSSYSDSDSSISGSEGSSSKKGIRKDSSDRLFDCEENLIYSPESQQSAEGIITSPDPKDTQLLNDNEDLEAARKQRRRDAVLSQRRKLRERRRAKLGQVTDFSL